MIAQTGVLIGGIVGFVVYIILCVIIANTAADTKRSGVGYFFLSFLLSPLVGFMALSLEMLAHIELAHPKQRKSTHQVTWECPKCHEKNPNSTFECEKCGYSLR